MTDRLNILSSGNRTSFGVSGTTSSSSATISSITTTNIYVGMKISGLSSIPANTFVESVGGSTVTMTNDATSAVSGIITFQHVNYDIPTNPQMALVKSLTTERIYAGVFPSDANSTLDIKEVGYSGSKGINYENENLANTEGFRIKCYDGLNDIGIQLTDGASTGNYTDALFNSNDFFVLIHSDNYLLHHVARVTQITRGDVNGDSFEFEPRLGTEIPKGTKFMLFQGPAKTTNPLAISVGIKNDLQFELNCSRPLFYFFNDRLDKNNQLDHNTKYYNYAQTTNSSGTISLASGVKATSLTVTDYAQDIVDYSRYNLKAKVVDNLRTLDAPKTNTSNEGNTPNSLDFTDYNDAFPNARRDTDDDHTSLQYRGNRRYLHYDYSPDNCNFTYNAYDNIIFESYGQRGSYSETKVADLFRVQDKKILENEPYRIRHRVHSGSLTDWFALDAKITADSSPTYTVQTPFDLTNFLNNNDEIKIGTKVFLVNSIGSFVNATGTTPASQTITLKSSGNKFSKEDGVAGAFTTSSDPTIAIDSIIYRRAFNRVDVTLMTDFALVDNRQNNLFVKLISKEYPALRASVTAIDVEKKLLTLSFSEKTYTTYSSTGGTALQFLTGAYELEIEKFNGTVEDINTYQENGQRILAISGRNNFSKLLSPVINKNTLHSKDIIYSSNSPYNQITLMIGKVIVCSFDSAVVTFKDSTSGSATTHGFTSPADVGKDIFVYHEEHETFSYAGRISVVDSTTQITLEQKSLAETSGNHSTEEGNDVGAYSTSKHYIFNKALSTNSFQSTSTDLTATSEKGLFFDSGQSLASDGSESATLVNTSANDDSRALGYYISDTNSVKSDSRFQARLDDNASSKNFETFDTINTLIDFSILSIKPSDTATLVEIAPHIPLTLGRVDINFANTQDTTFTDIGACSVGTSGNSFFTIDKDVSTALLSSTADPRKYHNKPIYANGVFIGNLLLSTLHTDHDTIYVYLDRKLSSTISTQTIQVLTENTYSESSKLTHELNLLNGGHLHSGKIISLLSPFVNDGSINKTMSMNYPLYYNTMDEEYTYIEKYGAPYYRIINLEKGNYNRITSTPTTNIKDIAEYYLETVSKVPYYASAYRFGFGNLGSDTTITKTGKTGHDTDTHILPESRGFTSVYGSRFFDSTLHKASGTAQRVLFTHDPTITNINADVAGTHENVFVAKDHITLLDHKAARMFLFANSDLHPYSSKRYDSLMYGSQTREISNYNFFALESPIETSSSDTKETIIGKTNTLTLNDSNYSSASIISADRTLSELKRFSLMRLTEVVFDWAFNQIDPENIISKERVIPKFKYSAFDFTSLATLFASTNQVATGDYNDYTVTGCSYNNGTTITHSSNTSIKAGMPVSGDGIPTGSIIASITDATHFELSATTTGGSKSGETLTFGSYIATDTTVNPNTLTAEREIIADSDGRYIGEVASTEFSSPNGKIILMDKARKTNGTNYFAGTLFSLSAMRNADGSSTKQVAEIKGHGKEDTFVRFNEEVHMMKSMVANDIGRYDASELHYGSHPVTIEVPPLSGSYYADSSWWRRHGEMIDFVGASSTVSGFKSPNIYLPINIGGDSILGSSIDYASTLITDHPFRLFDILHGSVVQIDNSAPTGNECLYNAHLPIFLDRFDIEDGGGSLVSKGTVGGAVTGIMRRDLNKSKEVSMFGLGLLNDFAEYKDGGSGTSSVSSGGASFSTTIDRSYDDDADGVMMGFKPRLYLTATTANTNKAAGNRTVYNYAIDLDTDITSITYFDDDDGDDSVAFANINRKSLKLMNDLTGCYLVSERGKYYDESFSVQSYSSVLANPPSLNEQTPNVIAYVISHEIDTTNSTERHILTLDTAIVTDFYRVMQPNHVCFYDFSPKKIRMNSLSSAYTKISGEDSCYSPHEINSYMVRNKSGGRSFARFHNTGGREAALSMYVAIDTDAQSDSSFIVQRFPDKMGSLLTANSDLTVAVSDGDNVYKTSLTYTDNSDDIGHFLTFDKMQETLGVASISEPITLTVNGDLSIESKRGMIGSVVTICKEGENLINDLLEENDIEFTITNDDDFPYFLAPNYKSIDLFSAINLILNKKQKTLVEQPNASNIDNPAESTFTVVNRTNTRNYPSVVLSDNGDYQIFAYEEVKSVFDFYNEIIVYGNTHKSIRKDLRSIKKLGRKTLEEYDNNLTTQEEVDDRALDLLRIHSDDNVRLNITVGHNNISQLQAGDIISVELVKEGLALEEYLVLQIKHLINGMMELELGKYSKKLEDRFAELISENKKVNSSIRKKQFDERSITFDLLDEVKVSVTKLLVRKITGTGASLGFSSTLNTNTKPMGYGGATTTLEDLLEEEY